MIEWFFRYENVSTGAFDIRDVECWYKEIDNKDTGYRVYLRSGKSHWLTVEDIHKLENMMARQ